MAKDLLGFIEAFNPDFPSQVQPRLAQEAGLALGGKSFGSSVRLCFRGNPAGLFFPEERVFGESCVIGAAESAPGLLGDLLQVEPVCALCRSAAAA